jgi:hypothetical protein
MLLILDWEGRMSFVYGSPLALLILYLPSNANVAYSKGRKRLQVMLLD